MFYVHLFHLVYFVVCDTVQLCVFFSLTFVVMGLLQLVIVALPGLFILIFVCLFKVFQPRQYC